MATMNVAAVRELAAWALQHGIARATLDPFGRVHGVNHWVNVFNNGLLLAKATPQANVKVITWFAFLHDCRRMNDDRDPGHGHRASELAYELREDGRLIMSAQEFIDLTEALRYHSDGITKGSVSAMVCWDADRLDLPRVGITPSLNLMCTEAARPLVQLLQRLK